MIFDVFDVEGVCFVYEVYLGEIVYDYWLSVCVFDVIDYWDVFGFNWDFLYMMW